MPSAFFDDSSITMNLKKISNSVSSWAIWKFGNGGNTSYDQKKSSKYKMSLSANALNGHIVDNGVNHTTSSSVSNLHIHRVNNNQMPNNSEQLNNNNESSCDINNSGSGVLRQSGARPKKQPSFVSRLRHRHSLYQKGKSTAALEPQVGASLCEASSTDSFNQSTNSFEFIDGGVTSFDDRASAPAHYHSQGLQQRENVGRRGDSLVLDNQGNVMSLCRSFHVASMDESLGVLSEETPPTSIDKTDNAVVMVESVPSNSKSLNRSQKHEKQSRKSVRNSTSGVQQFGHLLTKLSVFANLQGERSLDTTTSNQAPANTESVISSSTNDPDQSGTFLSDLMNANWAVESEPSSMCQSSLFDEELRQLYAVNGSTLSTKPIATGSTRAFSDSNSCSVDAPNLPSVSGHAEFTGSELARRRSCTAQIMVPPSKTAISSLAAQAKYHESLDESSGASAYTSPEHATSSDVEQIDTRCASKSLSEGLSRESRPKRSVTLRVSSKQIQKIKQRFKNARSPSNTFSNLKRSQGSFSSKRSEAAKSLPRSAKSIGFQGASSVDSSDSGILVVSNAGGKMTSSMIDHGVADQYHHPGSHVQINGSGIKHSQSHAVSTAHRLRPKSEGFYSTDHLTPTNNADCVPGHRQSRRERWLNHGAGGSPQMFCGKAENYEKLEKLGEGSYATVHKGFSHVHGKFVALKEIRLQAEEGTPFTAIREASLLKGLKHSNIVLLHDIIHTKDILTFVFEYVHTDLSKYLETCPSGMMPQNAKLFLYQLLRGLAFCHDRKILHRDLKPQNLLISELGELKLADFGLARAKSVPSHNYSHEVVTLWYRPPDVLLGSVDYTTSLDMWGVGCIFVEMLTGFPIFPGTRDVFDQLDRIFQVMGTPTDLYWEGVSKLPNYQTNKFGSYLPVQWSRVCPRVCKIPNAKSLVLSMLQMKPYKRVSALMSMTHPYFSDLPAQVHSLPPTSSIFIIPGVRLLPEAKTPGPYYRVAV